MYLTQVPVVAINTLFMGLNVKLTSSIAYAGAVGNSKDTTMGKQHNHKLTPGLVGILVKMIESVKESGHNKVHLQKDLALTHSEFANLQKLRYWGLIAKCKEGGERKKGYWVITRRGGEFLRNEKAMPKTVATLDNTIVGRSEDTVTISQFFSEAYPKTYWQEEFGIELNQTSLI